MNDAPKIVSPKNRYYVLDALRLVAALFVLFYHYSIYFDKSDELLLAVSAYGYLGVDFFFLLSGFVIMASAQKRSAFEFAFARGVRIYPAFIACLLVTVGAIYWLTGVNIPLKAIFANATILNDYLGISNIDGVYWTLQAELKFYGCVFLLLLTRLFSYFRFWISAWLAMAICYQFYNQPYFMSWFINPSYSFYFIAGVCAFLLSKNSRDWVVIICFWISAIFCVLVAGIHVPNFVKAPSSDFILIVRLIVFCFCVFFIALAYGYFNVKKVPWWWLYLGAVSYPLYLLHNRFGKTIIEHYMHSINIYLLLLLVSALVLMLGLFIHVYIEKPAAKLEKMMLEFFQRRRSGVLIK